MDYQQSLKNIENSINFVLPLYDEYCIFCSFENNEAIFKLILKEELGALVRSSWDKKLAYATIVYGTDSCIHYRYRDVLQEHAYNYDSNSSKTDYFIGNRGDVKLQLLSLVRLLKKSG